MKNYWKIPDEPEFIGKHKALKHKKTRELCLFGKYGEIWMAGVDKIGVLIKSSRVASRYLGKSGVLGDEFVIKLPLKELDKWIKILKVSKSLKIQLTYYKE